MQQAPGRALWRKERLEKPLPGKRFGSLQTLLTGSGIELKEQRPYQSGDAMRHINWKLSAKHQHRYVNTYEHERMQDITIFLDSNANWRGGTNDQWTLLVTEILADLAGVVQSSHAHVQLVYPDQQGGLCMISIRTNDQWGAALEHVFATLAYTPKTYTSGLAACTRFLQTMQKKRLVIMVSDFLNFSAQKESWDQLCQQHLVVPLRLAIPLAWTASGPMFLQTSEAERQTLLGEHMVLD